MSAADIGTCAHQVVEEVLTFRLEQDKLSDKGPRDGYINTDAWIGRELMLPERPHSPLGASSSKQWMNCRGRNNFINKLKGQKLIPPPKRGASRWTVTKEITDAAQVAVDYIWDLYKKHEDQGAELLLESDVDLRHEHPDLWGTSDIIVLIPLLKAWVYDYKNGHELVEVREDGKINPQLGMYAGDVFQQYMLQEVVLGIIQPNAEHPDGPIRDTVVAHEEMVAFINELAAAAEETESSTTLCAGSWCHWCPAKGHCPEHAKAAAVELFGDDDVVAAVQEDRALIAPEGLTPEAIGKIVLMTPKINAWLKSVNALAHDLATAGATPPGLKLVEGRQGNRTWNDDAVATLSCMFDEDDVYDYKIKSPAQIEKVAKAKGIDFDLDELTSRSPGSPTLVSESDKRPAITAESYFD